MAKYIPSKQDRDLARKVLSSYKKKAYDLAELTEQEEPTEIAHGLEVWIELLKIDPDKELDAYLEEYKAGR